MIVNFENRRHREWTVCLFAGVYSLLLLILRGEQYYVDTWSYAAAWDVVSRGIPDIFRTPVYPCIIGMARWLFGERLSWLAVCAVQIAVLLPSTVCFCRLAERLSGGGRPAFVVSILYAACSALWTNCLLTESLAISGTVILLWFTVSLYDRLSVVSAAGAAVTTALLVFLRPAMIYILPMLVVWWAVAGIAERKGRQAAAGIAGTVAVILMVLLYMMSYSRHYGVFSLSSVSDINRLAAAKIYAVESPAVIADESLREDLVNDADTVILCRRLKEYYKSHPESVAKGVFVNWYRSSRFRLRDNYMPFASNTLSEIFSLRMSDLYLFMVLCTLLVVCSAVRERRIPILTTLCVMWCVSHLFVIIVGAQAGYSRLSVPAMPVLLLLTAEVWVQFQRGRTIRLQ